MVDRFTTKNYDTGMVNLGILLAELLDDISKVYQADANIRVEYNAKLDDLEISGLIGKYWSYHISRVNETNDSKITILFKDMDIYILRMNDLVAIDAASALELVNTIQEILMVEKGYKL